MFSELPPEKLVTHMTGELPFTLDSKPYKFTIPASKKGPEEVRVIPVATQEQLEKLYKLGHKTPQGVPVIEKINKSASNG